MKIKPCQSLSHPEDSRRLKIVQNFVKDNVKKTAAFEDDKFEFNTKENAVDYAYMLIVAVYMLGIPSSMSRKKLSSSATETERNFDN